MIQSPSPTVDSGHDSAGRFGKGNKAGKGNPFNKRTQQIRAALILAVKPADIRAAVRKLVDQALASDRLALAEILDRTIGKPSAGDVLERIERLERALNARNENERR